MTTPTTITIDLPRCGLLRRVAAAFYDLLLLAAVLMLATALVLPLLGNDPATGRHPLLTTYLFLVSFAYFAWPWMHGGQTLGMKTWRIRLVRYDGGPISPWQALLRFLAALVAWGAAGLGVVWSAWDRERLAWHDRASYTLLVVVPKGR
jgi:uncharacterized RDD family membrane protein YckC